MTTAAVVNREDPTRDEWPGECVADDSEFNVRMACGDKRDWFTYEERLATHLSLEEEHRFNWERGRKMKFDFKLVLIIGKKGSGKSLLASYKLAQLYRSGVPVFHNGSLLFGNKLGILELYDSVDRVPVGSAIYLDEIHTINQTSRELATAQVTQNEAWAGLRKKDILVYIGTSMPGMIGRRTRGQCDEIWQPQHQTVRFNNSLDKAKHPWMIDSATSKEPTKPYRPADDRANFQFTYKRTDGNPWKDRSIESIFEPQTAKQEIGYAIYEKRLTPSWTRVSMMLLDSFLPLKIGVATIVNQKQMKARLEGKEEEFGRNIDLERVVVGLWRAFEEKKLEPAGFARATTLINLAKVDVSPPKMGQFLSKDLGIESAPNRRGYPLDELYEVLSDIVMNNDNQE